MTKLQLLHRALNERLMAAVEQIMEMVGGTVLEYEEETVRARRENEILRRRLRWMEGEIPTDWPDEVDLPGPEQSMSFADVPVQECLTVKTEPTDAFDSQSFRPDVSLTASVLTPKLETVDPGTSEPADASVPGGTVWDSTQNYMAPLDFYPTTPDQTERSAGSTNTSGPTAVTPGVPVSEEPQKESNEGRKDTGNNKYPENSAAKTVIHKSRTGQVRSKTPRCLECKRVFKTVSQLAMHMKTHRKQFPRQEELKEQEDTDKRPRQYHKMPLPSKVRSARHRQRVNSDPAARAEYLARRRESYQRRRLQGMIPYVKSSDLPERVKKKQREKWRAASSAYRERKKMTNAVLDFMPPSMENIPPVLVGVDVAQEQPEDAGRAVGKPHSSELGL